MWTSRAHVQSQSGRVRVDLIARHLPLPSRGAGVSESRHVWSASSAGSSNIRAFLLFPERRRRGIFHRLGRLHEAQPESRVEVVIRWSRSLRTELRFDDRQSARRLLQRLGKCSPTVTTSSGSCAVRLTVQVTAPDRPCQERCEEATRATSAAKGESHVAGRNLR